jgi:formate-dependent nitrite reductase cytochrome c552 subunit
MPHEKGDFSLRTTAPVTLANGKVFDVGHCNLCANCHKATVDAAKAVVALPSNKIDADWGPHRGPQADIVRGTNAYEFPGKKYGSSAHKDIINDGCISCHMNLPKGRAAGLSLQVGGHSFQLAGETLNLTACNSCHRDVTQAHGAPVFNVIAREDYDHNGKKEPYQLEVQGLLDQLVNKDGTGVLQSIDQPFYNSDGSFHAVKTDVMRSVAEVGALYNYRMIVNDRSLGIHNAKYAIQVLYDSIQALDPQFDTSLRPQ